jgi:cell pole-organizing protein PopZ
MSDKQEKKVSLASTASEILNKVNKAISGKKDNAKAEPARIEPQVEDDDVLELLEEAASPNLSNPAQENINPEQIFSPLENSTIPTDKSSYDALKAFENGMLNFNPSNEKNQNIIEEQLENTNPISPYNEEQVTQGNNMTEKLVSENTAETTAALFNQLKHTAKSKQSAENLKFRSGTTVEDVIIELVKPHLREWLDQNLHSIVKATVEKEVKKLIPNEE